MAISEGLAVVDMERLLLFGHRLALSDLDTKNKVRRVYEDLLPYGGSLQPWTRCWLRTQL